MAPKHPLAPDSDTSGPDASDSSAIEDGSSPEEEIFQRGPLPERRFIERPVEIHFRSLAIKAALLPYFALAFTPVNTDGAADLGIYFGSFDNPSYLDEKRPTSYSIKQLMILLS